MPWTGKPIDAPGSNGKAIFVSCLAFPPISLFVLCLRLWCRTTLIPALGWRGSFGWDDLTAVLTWVFIVVFSALMSLAAHVGFGMHKWQLTPADRISFFKSITIFSPAYILAVGGYKATLLLLYLRIFNSSQTYRWFCRVALFVVCGTAISNMIVKFVGCRPLEKFWNSKIPGTCPNFFPINAVYAALAVFNDFVVALLPIPIVWRLHMETWRKATVLFILGFGVVAFIIALLRFIFAALDQRAADRTYFALGSPIWSVAEVNIGLMVSCVPALKPLFNTLQKLVSRRSRTGRSDPLPSKPRNPLRVFRSWCSHDSTESTVNLASAATGLSHTRASDKNLAAGGGEGGRGEFQLEEMNGE